MYKWYCFSGSGRMRSAEHGRVVDDFGEMSVVQLLTWEQAGETAAPVRTTQGLRESAWLCVVFFLLRIFIAGHLHTCMSTWLKAGAWVSARWANVYVWAFAYSVTPLTECIHTGSCVWARVRLRSVCVCARVCVWQLAALQLCLVG